jgi:hypothetical protein
MNNITALVFFCVAVILVGLLLFIVICLNKKGGKHLNVEYYRTQCLKYENQLRRDEPSTFPMAVLNADKLVEQAMREKGMKGQTMGEKLKNSPKSFSDINGLWNAHKLRNRIAHEPNIEVKYEETRAALMQFRKALKDLGAI